MLGDDAEFEIEPLAVFLLGVAGRDAGAGEPRAEAGFARACAIRSASSTTLSPTEKRGRIGAWVCGRKAQRSAISTVEASASGRSANSAPSRRGS